MVAVSLKKKNKKRQTGKKGKKLHSGKKMGNAVFAQTLKVINKQADGEKVIQVPIDLYTKTEDGKQWLATHVDGLP